MTPEQYRSLDAKLDGINRRLDFLGSRASIQASRAQGHTQTLAAIKARVDGLAEGKALAGPES